MLIRAGVTAAAALLTIAAGPRAVSAQKAPIRGQAETCAACHPEITSDWAASIHRRTVGAPQISESRQACAACHRGIDDHLADVTDVAKRPSLKGMSGEAISAICSSCHQGGKQSLWSLSPHARTEDGCLTCHDPHHGEGTQMLKAPEPELCQTCHPVQVAEGNMPSHHPIREGKMVCTDCHNVHGEERGSLPEASNGEMCFKCHAEKAGPFQAEHPPVTEDCTICHRPHGSPVDNLLIQDQPILCLQCHPGHSDGHRTPIVSLTPESPDAIEAINAFYGRCTSCHSRIHGSDLLSGSGNPTFMPGLPLEGGSEAESGLVGAAALDPAMWGFADFRIGSFDSEDNPTYVREYDGKNYERPDADLSFVRFGENDDLRMEVLNVDAGADQELSLRYGKPTLDIKLKASGLTHRLGRYDDMTDVLIPRDTGRTMQVNTTDLANGKSDYELGRTLIELELAARCPKLPQAKWLLNFWQEKEHGSRQFLFLDRCTSCHKIQTSEPIDRVTTITEGGVQVDLPKGSLRYLHGKQRFSNFAEEQLYDFAGTSSVFNGPAPLFGVAPTETRTNDLRGAFMLGSRASAAALWRSKQRDDRLGGGSIDIHTGGGGVSYALSPDLRLQGSVYRRSLDETGIDEGISRDRDTTRLDLRYTGIPHAVWSAGFAKEKVSRTERQLVPDDSDSNVWTTAFNYYPLSRLWLQLRYRKTDTDNGAFFSDEEVPAEFPARLPALPSDGSLLSAILGYQLRGDTLVSGIYSKKHDIFDVDVPAPAADRSSDEEIKTYGLQLSQSRPRSQLSAGLFHQTGSTLTNAWYGTEEFILAPPLVGAEVAFPPIDAFASYDYSASIATLNGSVSLTSRWRLFAHYYQTTTDGEVTGDGLGDYIDQNPDLNGVAVVLNPFDITIRDWWLGTGYRYNPRTELVLSYQHRSWTDDDNATHDGSYNVWRLGARRSF
ncbi:MAG: DmsE family decaheme c-type cytochrome [Armatimonadota bacterium]